MSLRRLGFLIGLPIGFYFTLLALAARSDDPIEFRITFKFTKESIADHAQRDL